MTFSTDATVTNDSSESFAVIIIDGDVDGMATFRISTNEVISSLVMECDRPYGFMVYLMYLTHIFSILKFFMLNKISTNETNDELKMWLNEYRLSPSSPVHLQSLFSSATSSDPRRTCITKGWRNLEM